ncbi:membrane lipoprotein [Haloplasma contractile SSD-17B]|uniref:Membrane lipoprotein n=2 Tax=Haloplasma TaxID=471824 RepID=U2FI60_9MOLU|nr:membrane lipoprotein [Haloplasma contractile SSD-17B]
MNLNFKRVIASILVLTLVVMLQACGKETGLGDEETTSSNSRQTTEGDTDSNEVDDQDENENTDSTDQASEGFNLSQFLSNDDEEINHGTQLNRIGEKYYYQARKGKEPNVHSVLTFLDEHGNVIKEHIDLEDSQVIVETNDLYLYVNNKSYTTLYKLSESGEIVGEKAREKGGIAYFFDDGSHLSVIPNSSEDGGLLEFFNESFEQVWSYEYEGELNLVADEHQYIPSSELVFKVVKHDDLMNSEYISYLKINRDGFRTQSEELSEYRLIRTKHTTDGGFIIYYSGYVDGESANYVIKYDVNYARQWEQDLELYDTVGDYILLHEFGEEGRHGDKVIFNNDGTEFSRIAQGGRVIVVDDFLYVKTYTELFKYKLSGDVIWSKTILDNSDVSRYANSVNYYVKDEDQYYTDFIDDDGNVLCTYVEPYFMPKHEDAHIEYVNASGEFIMSYKSSGSLYYGIFDQACNEVVKVYTHRFIEVSEQGEIIKLSHDTLFVYNLDGSIQEEIKYEAYEITDNQLVVYYVGDGTTNTYTVNLEPKIEEGSLTAFQLNPEFDPKSYDITELWGQLIKNYEGLSNRTEYEISRVNYRLNEQPVNLTLKQSTDYSDEPFMIESELSMDLGALGSYEESLSFIKENGKYYYIDELRDVDVKREVTEEEAISATENLFLEFSLIQPINIIKEKQFIRDGESYLEITTQFTLEDLPEAYRSVFDIELDLFVGMYEYDFYKDLIIEQTVVISLDQQSIKAIEYDTTNLIEAGLNEDPIFSTLNASDLNSYHRVYIYHNPSFNVKRYEESVIDDQYNTIIDASVSGEVIITSEIIKGEFEYRDDTDVYPVSIMEAGTYGFYIEATHVEVELYDEYGVLVTDPLLVETDFAMDLDKGTYYLVIECDFFLGTYEFKIEPVMKDDISNYFDEGFETNQGDVLINDVTRSQIDYVGDSDIFKVEVNQDGMFVVKAPVIDGLTLIHIERDPSSGDIKTNHELKMNDGERFYNVMLSDYYDQYIIVQSSGYTGDYQFETSLYLEADDVENVMDASAPSVVIEEDIESVFLNNNDEDVFQITVPQDGIYKFRGNLNNGNFVTMKIYNQDLQYIRSMSGSTSRQLFIQLVEGTYYIELSSYSKGTYRVESERVVDDQTSFETLSLNQLPVEISGSIDYPYEQDGFLFTIAEPTFLRFKFTEGYRTGEFKLLDTNGERVFKDEFYTNIEDGKQWEYYVLPGDYTIELNKTYSNTGLYTVMIETNSLVNDDYHGGNESGVFNLGDNSVSIDYEYDHDTYVLTIDETGYYDVYSDFSEIYYITNTGAKRRFYSYSRYVYLTAGEYEIELYHETPGDYTYTVTEYSEDYPDDTVHTLKLNEELTGLIDHKDDIDRFTIHIGEGGTYKLTYPLDYIDIMVKNTDTEFTTIPTIDYKLDIRYMLLTLDPGDYQIEVSNNQKGFHTVDYTIKLEMMAIVDDHVNNTGLDQERYQMISLENPKLTIKDDYEDDYDLILINIKEAGNYAVPFNTLYDLGFVLFDMDGNTIDWSSYNYFNGYLDIGTYYYRSYRSYGFEENFTYDLKLIKN